MSKSGRRCRSLSTSSGAANPPTATYPRRTYPQADPWTVLGARALVTATAARSPPDLVYHRHMNGTLRLYSERVRRSQARGEPPLRDTAPPTTPLRRHREQSKAWDDARTRAERPMGVARIVDQHAMRPEWKRRYRRPALRHERATLPTVPTPRAPAPPPPLPFVPPPSLAPRRSAVQKPQRRSRVATALHDIRKLRSQRDLLEWGLVPVTQEDQSKNAGPQERGALLADVKHSLAHRRRWLSEIGLERTCASPGSPHKARRRRVQRAIRANDAGRLILSKMGAAQGFASG